VHYISFHVQEDKMKTWVRRPRKIGRKKHLAQKAKESQARNPDPYFAGGASKPATPGAKSRSFAFRLS
jgi:hypothetical protein